MNELRDSTSNQTSRTREHLVQYTSSTYCLFTLTEVVTVVTKYKGELPSSRQHIHQIYVWRGNEKNEPMRIKKDISTIEVTVQMQIRETLML